jgi:hypothetical protein
MSIIRELRCHKEFDDLIELCKFPFPRRIIKADFSLVRY